MIDCHSVFHENCGWLLKQYNMSGRGVVCEYYIVFVIKTQEYCLSSQYERSEQPKLLAFSFEVKWDFCRFPLNIIDHDKCVKSTASTLRESVSCDNIQHIHYIITSQTWLLSKFKSALVPFYPYYGAFQLIHRHPKFPRSSGCLLYLASGSR